MQPEKPQKEHEWLQQLVGDWKFEMPDMRSGETHVGTETVRSIGGLWIQSETRGQMPGGSPFISQLTLGYDPKKGKFVGTWLGSTMTYLWVYEGTLNESKTVLTLETEGPMPDGKTAKVREIIELKSSSERTFSSFMLGDDGEWKQLMVVTSRRASAASEEAMTGQA